MKIIAITCVLILFSSPVFAKRLTENECSELKGTWKLNSKKTKGRCKLTREGKKLAKAKRRCEKAKGSFDLAAGTCSNAQCKRNKVWDDKKGKCLRSKKASSDKRKNKCLKYAKEVKEENKSHVSDEQLKCEGDKRTLRKTTKLLKTIVKCQKKTKRKLMKNKRGRLKCVKASKWVDFSKVKIIPLELNERQKKKCNKILVRMKKKSRDGNVKAKHLNKLKKKKCLDFQVIE
jgi:hypothetical protein